MKKKKIKKKIFRRVKKLSKGLPETSRKFAYDIWIEPHQADTKSFKNIKIVRPKHTKGKLLK